MRRSAAASTASAMADKRGQRLMAVLPLPRSACARASMPTRSMGVEEHRDLHAVADRERQALQQRAARGDLACEWLYEPGKLGAVQVQQGPREQLGDAPAAARQDGLTDPERPPEAALHERERLVGEHRRDEARDEAGEKTSLSAST